MGNNCTSTCESDPHGKTTQIILNKMGRFNLDDMDIREFEMRVKRYAHPIN